MGFEAFHHAKCVGDEQGRQQERQAEPHCVNRHQIQRAAHVVALHRHGQDARQDRAVAGRPAKGEGQPQNISPQRRTALIARI